MLAFDDIKLGSRRRDLDARETGEVVQIAHFCTDTLSLGLRVSGGLIERLVYRGEEASLALLAAYRANARGGRGEDRSTRFTTMSIGPRWADTLESRRGRF
jgi:hypothetical protein